jgi:hypothetical protein
LLTLSLGAGCYNDNLQDLYPGTGGNCHTDSVKFSATIQPIMNQSCALSGCHDASTAMAGVNLSDYPGVQAVATSGRLVGTVTHAAGFSPMPKNMDKLDDCKLSQIQKWVADGAKNN